MFRSDVFKHFNALLLSTEVIIVTLLFKLLNVHNFAQAVYHSHFFIFGGGGGKNFGGVIFLLNCED